MKIILLRNDLVLVISSIDDMGDGLRQDNNISAIRKGLNSHIFYKISYVIKYVLT